MLSTRPEPRQLTLPKLVEQAAGAPSCAHAGEVSPVRSPVVTTDGARPPQFGPHGNKFARIACNTLGIFVGLCPVTNRHH